MNLFLKIIKAKIAEEVGSFECGSVSKIGFDEDIMHLEIPEDDTDNWKMNGLNQLKVYLIFAFTLVIEVPIVIVYRLDSHT